MQTRRRPGPELVTIRPAPRAGGRLSGRWVEINLLAESNLLAGLYFVGFALNAASLEVLVRLSHLFPNIQNARPILLFAAP